MAHSAAGAASHGSSVSTISVPWVIAAALLIGVGLFIISYFMVTFQFVYLGGIALVVGGGFMLFDERAGPDHA
ncbi:MAG: hypothetical protein L3K19_08615 [Thermoplasmata archaeon]|nr:hypothetical protein [Thermoplasmata archaeon]